MKFHNRHILMFGVFLLGGFSHAAAQNRPLAIRGIYGGAPPQIAEQGQSLRDYGVNAIWIGSGSVTPDRIDELRKLGAEYVFAEFNTMHAAEYLRDHPDAAPIGPDGQVSPPPDGWQGICPTHPGYRKWRMDEFRSLLQGHEIDGVWLDYHHAHASWERAEPLLPDTCFCTRCLDAFSTAIDRPLPKSAGEFRATDLDARRKEALGPLSEQWVGWRCDVFTDWVREFREIVNATRPKALLGTFHCPWTDTERDGALRNKLAIDLRAQAPYLDVFSPMPYHARFGHAQDVAWISRQTDWLGDFLGIQGAPDDRWKIWPIVQLADWGEPVPVAQVQPVLEQGTQSPATGVMIFHGSGLSSSQDKLDAVGHFYRNLLPDDPGN